MRSASIEGSSRDSSSTDRAMWLGVLAGGRGVRMGGRDKSRLPAPDTGEALAARIVRLARSVGLEPVIIGGTALPKVAHVLDAPPGIGPIGGLCALLQHALQNASPRANGPHARARAHDLHAHASLEGSVLAVACDLPHVTAELIARIAQEAPSATVLAPRDPLTGKWQPLFARYAAEAMLPVVCRAIAAGTHSMQTVLRSLEVTELSLSEAERAALHDWDTPADL